MNEQTYPSDLTDEEWEWIKELIPAAKSGGRPRTLCMRAVLNSGDSPELAQGLPYKGKSMRNRGVSSPMPFLLIPRSLLRGGFISPDKGYQNILIPQ